VGVASYLQIRDDPFAKSPTYSPTPACRTAADYNLGFTVISNSLPDFHFKRALHAQLDLIQFCTLEAGMAQGNACNGITGRAAEMLQEESRSLSQNMSVIEWVYNSSLVLADVSSRAHLSREKSHRKLLFRTRPLVLRNVCRSIYKATRCRKVFELLVVSARKKRTTRTVAE